jgi:hypothetical protein
MPQWTPVQGRVICTSWSAPSMNLSESTSSTNLEKTGYLKGFDGFVKTVICTNTNIKQCIYSSYVAKKSMGGGKRNPKL